MQDPKLIRYKYNVVIEPAILCVGPNPESTEDVGGFNIDLVKYSLWDDGDKCQEKRQTITSSTNEKEAEYLKHVVRNAFIFTLSFELGITHSQAYDMLEKKE